MYLSCLTSTAQIATYSLYFGASLSLMVFDICSTCFRGSTSISGVTNWRWISPGASHFTRKHRIGLRISKFDHVSKKSALFKWILWRCERLSCPLEPAGLQAPSERARHTMKSALDDAISCEIYRYIIFWNLLSIISEILFIGSLQWHLLLDGLLFYLLIQYSILFNFFVTLHCHLCRSVFIFYPRLSYCNWN